MKQCFKLGKILIMILLLILVCCVILTNITYANTLGYIENDSESFEPVIHYNEIDKTSTGIEKYRCNVNEKINEIINGKLDDIKCTITFSKKISVSELSSFAVKDDIDIELVEVRFLKGTDRYTSAIIFNGDYEDLENEINTISKNMDIDYVGIIDVYAKVDSEILSNVMNHPDVYIADISGDAAVIGNYETNAMKRNETYVDNKLDSFPCALSWDLEDLKIIE